MGRLLPRDVRHDEQHDVEVEALHDTHRRHQVTDVRRIERPAEHADASVTDRALRLVAAGCPWTVVVPIPHSRSEVGHRTIVATRSTVSTRSHQPTSQLRASHADQCGVGDAAAVHRPAPPPPRELTQEGWNQMSDSVGMYLNEIGAVALLTTEEERDLSRTIEKGIEARRRKAAGERGRDLDKQIAAAAAAKDRFIRANLRLVVSVARRYPLPPGMELLDLVQEGNLGLEHAVDKFDWRKGFKFSTYATFWIRQAIGRSLDQKASLVRLPGDRSAALRCALRAVSGDADELDDENARLHRLTTPTSLDRTVGDDDSNELIDLLADDKPGPEAELLDAEHDEWLHGLLDVLDPRARTAVESRFGLSDGRRRSYREVGEDLGVTAEAARRLVKRAVTTVRDRAMAASPA